MQKLANILSIILVVLSSGAAFIYYHDDMDIQIPYLYEIYMGIALFLVCMLLIKMSFRWQAIMLALKSKGYHVSSVGFQKVMVYEGIVLLYFGLFGFIMTKYIDVGFWLGIVAVIMFLEGLANLATQAIAKPYKVILNDKSITLITNELVVVRWSEVKKIDSRQNDIHIIHKNDEPTMLDLEWLSESDQHELINKITNIAQAKNIFCSIDVKGNYKDFTKLAMQTNFED